MEAGQFNFQNCPTRGVECSHFCRRLQFPFIQIFNIFSIQKNLAEDAPDWLLTWQSRMQSANAWLLNEVGWEEHHHLAQTFKKLNPEIFDERKYTVTSSFKVINIPMHKIEFRNFNL